MQSLRLRFVQSAGSLTSTISLRQLWRTRSTFTTSSYETAYGIGSDGGRMIYWLGERAIDGYMEVKIRARLSSIRRRLGRRGIATVTPEREKALRDAYADLVEFCGEKYPLRFRRRAIQLLVEVVRPLDAWSMVLMRSNFVNLLATCQLELCEDWRIHDAATCLANMVSAFHELSCKCTICLRALKVSFDLSLSVPVPLEKAEGTDIDNHESVVGDMYIQNGFFGGARHGQI